MKILILGGRGRLAMAMAREWSARHDVTSLGREELDVAEAGQLQKELEARDFNVLVNGSGLTNVDLCETERELAVAVNATAPGVMARCARARKARFLHVSTDYVFDGREPRELDEEDAANPLGWYGRTKLDGERAVLSDDPAHVVARVSWVFGPDKPSFVDLMIERARTSDTVAAVADKFSSPTHAADAAAWFEPFFEPSMPGGLFHACHRGGCSWRDYAAHALACAAEAGVPLRTTEVGALALANMKQFLAPRPIHTILKTAKLTRVTGLHPRPWQDAVRDYVFQKYAPFSSAI